MKKMKRVICLTSIFLLIFTSGAIATREAEEIGKARQALINYFSYWRDASYGTMWEDMLTNYAKKRISKEEFVAEFQRAEKDGIFVSHFEVTEAIFDYYGTVTLTTTIHVVSVEGAYDSSRHIMLYKEGERYKVNYVPSYVEGEIEGLLP